MVSAKSELLDTHLGWLNVEMAGGDGARHGAHDSIAHLDDEFHGWLSSRRVRKGRVSVRAVFRQSSGYNFCDKLG